MRKTSLSLSYIESNMVIIQENVQTIALCSYKLHMVCFSHQSQTPSTALHSLPSLESMLISGHVSCFRTNRISLLPVSWFRSWHGCRLQEKETASPCFRREVCSLWLGAVTQGEWERRGGCQHSKTWLFSSNFTPALGPSHVNQCLCE